MPEWVELRRKNSQRGLLIISYQRLEKRLYWAITPASEAGQSLHTWRRQGPRKPSSSATFTLNSHWDRAATGKKKSCVYVHRVALVMSNSAALWTVAFQVSLSERGVLQARILEHIGQYWLPYPSRALYFLLP